MRVVKVRDLIGAAGDHLLGFGFREGNNWDSPGFSDELEASGGGVSAEEGSSPDSSGNSTSVVEAKEPPLIRRPSRLLVGAIR